MKPTKAQARVLSYMADGYRLMYTRWAGPDAAYIRLERRNDDAGRIGYDTLRAMDRNGWLTMREKNPGGYPTRFIYSLSKAGRAAARV